MPNDCSTKAQVHDQKTDYRNIRRLQYPQAADRFCSENTLTRGERVTAGDHLFLFRCHYPGVQRTGNHTHPSTTHTDTHIKMHRVYEQQHERAPCGMTLMAQ